MTSLFRRRIGGAAIAAILAAGVIAAQAPIQPAPPQSAQRPAFRSGVDLVPVDVSVLDRNRVPVLGLTAADFTVLEDGKPRPIQTFSAVTLPEPEMPPAMWMRDVAPDVASNLVAPDGRLVVILFDRSIAPTLNPVARKIAETAVDALGPGDLAAVIFTARGVPQGFTSDRRRLLAAIDQPFMGLPNGDAGNPGECRCGNCTLEAIALVAESVRDVPRRRKTLLFIGTDVSVDSATAECGSLMRDARESAIREAQAANLTIDAIDPTGLESLGGDASIGGIPNNERAGGALHSLMERQGRLAVYPDHTGGRAVVNTNAPEATLRAILRESESYYVLGFPPAATKADGHFHSIEVKVQRPGVTIQARQGYYAPGGKPPIALKPPPGVSQGLLDSMASLWPRTDLPLDLDVASFAVPGKPEAAVAVIVRAHPPAGASSDRRVNVLSGAFDRFGKSLDYERATLIVPGAAGEYEVLTRLALRPGRYEIRAALEEQSAGERGSIYSYVDVPNFQAARDLLASGLVFDATPPAVAGPRSAFSDVLPIVPTARRAFSRGATATAFVRLYAGPQPSVAPVRIDASLKDSADRVVFTQSSQIPAEAFAATRTADYQLDLPLARLEPGEYLLSVAFVRASTTETREARLRMVP